MNEYRYEIKFSLDEIAYAEAMRWLQVNTSATKRYDDRCVNSLYFDNPGYSSIRDNITGLSDRSKYRIRWYGDKNKSYTYSGITMTPLPWTKELLKVRKEIEVFSQQEFNSVLLNYYRSGDDSVSWHSDDEDELGELPVIGSVSFGGLRKFRFRNKEDKTQTRTYELENGSLLLMKGNTQKYWEHEVPKTKKKVLVRINLTFRFIV